MDTMLRKVTEVVTNTIVAPALYEKAKKQGMPSVPSLEPKASLAEQKKTPSLLGAAKPVAGQSTLLGG